MRRLIALAALPLAGCAFVAPAMPSTPAPPPPTSVYDPGEHWDPIDGCEYPMVRTVVGTCVIPQDDRSTWSVDPCPPFSGGDGVDYHDPSCYPK